MKPAKEQYQHLQYAHFLAQTMGDKSLSFDLWTANLKLASYIGDTAFYIMCQKQSLANLEEMKHPNAFYIKIIYLKDLES